jgi:hypothetical protein
MRLAEEGEDEIPRSLASDTLEIVGHGGIPLVSTRENDIRPEQLLDGGDHNDDTSLQFRRQFARRGIGRNDVLPRDRLHNMIVTGGFRRPTPKKWQSTQNE